MNQRVLVDLVAIAFFIGVLAIRAELEGEDFSKPWVFALRYAYRWRQAQTSMPHTHECLYCAFRGDQNAYLTHRCQP